jgi:hypothetical protein
MTLNELERPRLVVYGDFNCPFSALASARAAVLEARGVVTVDWRAVEHDLAIPLAGAPLTPEERAAFAGELQQIRELLVDGEVDRLRIPGEKANTRLATAAYAATPDHLRSHLREALYAAYWTRGEDITDIEVIWRLGAEHRDELTAARWHTEWLALERPIVPVMVLLDGYVSRGLGVLARLLEFIRESEVGPRIDL